MIPQELSRLIAVPEGCRVVLVLGAGCSYPPPTNLPLARELAERTHRRLVQDNVLIDGQCKDPSDLSALADLIFELTGHQNALVDRFNQQRFRGAEPNLGYRIAAALLRERAVASVLTLNFDLAMSSALANIGGTEVSVINGPQDIGLLGPVNVIYLHRNANADPDDWTLRTVSLERDWKGGWQDVLAQRVLTAPAVIFAGLGTPTAVLIETIRRIRAAIGDRVHVFQVDPAPRESSPFFGELRIEEQAYLREDWDDFMSELGQKLLQEHQADLEEKCRAMIAAQDLANENYHDVATKLCIMGFLESGESRARWLMERTNYLPYVNVEPDWIADLLLGVALLERITQTTAKFNSDGVLELQRDNRTLATLVVLTGRGVQSWLALEAGLQGWMRLFRSRNPLPRFALVSGVQGSRYRNISPPSSIIPSGESADIIPSGSDVPILDVSEVRQEPELAKQVLSL